MRVIPDPAIQHFAGHLAGSNVVMFHYQGGQFARAWRNPANPSSTNQNLIRGLISNASKAWAGLTSSEVAGWVAYAAQYYTVVVNGVSRNPGGFRTFLKVYLYRSLTGLTVPGVFPTSAPPPQLTNVTDIESSAGSIIATQTHAISPITNYKLGCRITPATANLNRRPLARDLRYVKGVNTTSFVALPASASTATWTTATTAPAAGTRAGATFIVISPQGVPSALFGFDGTIS